jgi:hypothetical protein
VAAAGAFDPMPIIPDSEISRHSSWDLKGYVFHWENRIFRAIYREHESEVRQLFECGLIDELSARALFPPTEITEYETNDCRLVLRHEKISVPTLPAEWSFSMLKDAALTMLRVNLVARRFGYQTIDAHGFNILFDRGAAFFVDIGSFVKIENDFNCSRPGWRPYGEFMRFFYAPLKIWSKGETFLARQALYGDQMPMTTFWRHRNPALRLVPIRLLKRFEYLYHKYKALNTIPVAEFRQLASLTNQRERIGKLVLRISEHKLLWSSSVNLERLCRRVEKIRPPRITTAWAGYQDSVELSDRHKHILSCIDRLGPRTVLDMAGNAGFLSRQIARNCQVDHVICADYDENAIDTLYDRLKREKLDVFPAVSNFSLSVTDTKFPGAPQRFKSEAVLALALTHHLILSQGLSLDFIFDRLKSFSSRYVLVEFMPMGLYSSHHRKIPLIPTWYNLDWFRARFERYFTLLEETELDLNRVLLVGEVRQTQEEQLEPNRYAVR